jgi:uncharacterized membrane protein YccC
MELTRMTEIATHPGFDKIMRMLVLALCLTLLAGTGFYCLISGKNPDGISMMITAIISIALQIVGFDWGSSAGSRKKDEVIGKLLGSSGKDDRSQNSDHE